MKLFFSLKDGSLVLVECTKKLFFCWPLMGMMIILAWTKCLHVTKHVLSSTHFLSCFFLTFPLKYYQDKKIKLYIKDYVLHIYTFIVMIILWRSIHFGFQSHQMCTFSAGLGMARNRDGLSWSSLFNFVKINQYTCWSGLEYSI